MTNIPIWQPSSERIAAANVTRFMRFVNERHGLSLEGYPALYDWSVEASEDF